MNKRGEASPRLAVFALCGCAASALVSCAADNTPTPALPTQRPLAPFNVTETPSMVQAGHPTQSVVPTTAIEEAESTLTNVKPIITSNDGLYYPDLSPDMQWLMYLADGKYNFLNLSTGQTCAEAPGATDWTHRGIGTWFWQADGRLLHIDDGRLSVKEVCAGTSDSLSVNFHVPVDVMQPGSPALRVGH
jgi:hypothetical protein